MKTQIVNLQIRMAQSRCGRIVFHVIVFVRSGHWKWMQQGISRELWKSS